VVWEWFVWSEWVCGVDCRSCSTSIYHL